MTVDTNFILCNTALLLSYSAWKFTILNPNAKVGIQSQILLLSVLFILILAFVLLEWKMALISILVLFLWTFPANWLIFQIFKKLRPEISKYSYREFLTTSHERNNRKRANPAKTEHPTRELINQLTSNKNDKNWTLPAKALKTLESLGLKSEIEINEMLSDLSMTSNSVQKTLLNNPSLLKEYIEMKRKNISIEIILLWLEDQINGN